MLIFALMRLQFIVFGFLALTACNDAKTLPETEHLEKAKMIDVMTDMALMEASINIRLPQSPNPATDTSLKFNIYSDHNIKKSLYDSSLTYYGERPDELKEIYDSVMARLTKMKQNNN